MRQEEFHLQCAIVSWLKYQHPDVLFTASAGGVRTSIGTARKLKRMGALAGYPDLTILLPRGQYCACFIELKTPRGQATSKQKEVIKRLNRLNYFAKICRGFDNTVETIQWYLELGEHK
jgi:hypothetical protein